MTLGDTPVAGDAAIWAAMLAMQRHSWEQGVASHAAMDSGRADAALALARDAVARVTPEGMLGAMGDGGLVNGGSLVEAASALAETGDITAGVALDRQRWWLLRYAPRADSGVLYHLAGLDEVWVDTVYMAVPALVATRDFAPADMQYRMHREQLLSSESGLWSNRRNVTTGQWSRQEPWGTGNGWVAAGLARALRLGGDGVPTEMRSRWQRDLGQLLDALAPHARPDGRFHTTVLDPESFVDGTAGLLVAFAAFTGVADGYLEPRHADAADAYLAGALALLDGHGIVREVCAPPDFDSPGFSVEGQAAAILALAARARLE